MSLLDIFKKKTDEVSVTPGTSLDNLPPVPQNPDSVTADLVAPSPEQGLPPSPLDESATAVNVPTLESVAPDEVAPLAPASTPESGLEVPFLDELNSINSLDEPVVDGGEKSLDVAAKPVSESPESNLAKEELVEEKNTPLDEVQETDNLPNFDDLNEEISQERTGEQLAFDEGSSADIKTESLLLKSIFVEREHYANILFSLKRVKDDLKKSGPQQRKLSHVDMKLGKEYSKLSTSYENFNENLMIIEHILSNEQF